jgi:hypothetical protein
MHDKSAGIFEEFERLFSCVPCGLPALSPCPAANCDALQGHFSFPALNMFVIEIADLFCRFGL